MQDLEADGRLSSEDIHLLLQDPTIHYRVHNSTPLYPIPSQINPLHTPFLKYFNTFLPSDLLSGFLPFCMQLFPHACYMIHASDLPWSDYLNNHVTIGAVIVIVKIPTQKVWQFEERVIQIILFYIHKVPQVLNARKVIKTNAEIMSQFLSRYQKQEIRLVASSERGIHRTSCRLEWMWATTSCAGGSLQYRQYKFMGSCFARQHNAPLKRHQQKERTRRTKAEAEERGF